MASGWSIASRSIIRLTRQHEYALRSGRLTRMPIGENVYALKIDFQRDSPDPSRVFRSMTALIEAFTSLDRELVQSIDVHIEPIVLLEDIEASSLKAWLRTIVEAVDDTGLKQGDWKKVVGEFLYKAKYRIIDWTKGKTSITDRSDIQQLESELLHSAEETNVKMLPAYMPIPADRLLKSIQSINYALAELSKQDKAELQTPDGIVPFNMSFEITPSSFRELIVKESLANEQTLILKVKKPDYLGSSMWEFRYGSHSIEAKVLDVLWLRKFQCREIDVRPQDALRARVNAIAHYGYDGEVVGMDYQVLEVLEMLPANEPEQGNL